MSTELEKLTAQREAIQMRRKRRSEADRKDREELYRLDNAIERATAKSLIGCDVVLNPNASIGHRDLRKLRGMTAQIESVGQKYAHIKFTNGEQWRVCFHNIVAATPENSTNDGGEVADSVADLLNGAMSRAQ